MRTLLAATCLLASTSLASARPPQTPYSKAVQSRATTLTQALAHRIRFNEAQYLRVKQLHLRYLGERQELEASGLPVAERDTQLAAAQLRYEQELNDLLAPQQRVAYHQLRASLTAHRL